MPISIDQFDRHDPEDVTNAERVLRFLVRHKAPNWAVGDLDRVREATVFHSSAASLDDELGEESREAWLEAADGKDGDE